MEHYLDTIKLISKVYYTMFINILYFVQSDIFDKSKVILKPVVLVVFYSPTNCRRQYHCEAISLAAANTTRR